MLQRFSENKNLSIFFSFFENQNFFSQFYSWGTMNKISLPRKIRWQLAGSRIFPSMRGEKNSFSDIKWLGFVNFIHEFEWIFGGTRVSQTSNFVTHIMPVILNNSSYIRVLWIYETAFFQELVISRFNPLFYFPSIQYGYNHI